MPTQRRALMAEAPDLAERAAGMQWYHTMELAPGLVTPGWFDLRGVPNRIQMPASLAGKRVLDVGTFDGFWAFEMEDRGAAEVLAVDVLDPLEWDWPAGSSDEVVRTIGERKGAGEGFELAAAARRSSVQRQELNIYDLTPDKVGVFDFVYIGSLLLHLRDPVAGLASVRSVCKGQLLLLDAADPMLTLMHPRRPVADLDGKLRPWWWKPNRAGLVRMLEAAGFEILGAPRWVFMPPGAGKKRPPLRPRVLRRRLGREALRDSWFGEPHLAILAQPAVGSEDRWVQTRHAAP